MSDEDRRVVLLADRITNPDRAGTVRAVVERLESHGYTAVLLCETATESIRRAVPVVECVGLTDRWRLPWTSPGVDLNRLLPRPDLLHVLQTRMAPAGLELAERWGLPYLQTIEEFLPEGSKIRLSRRWSRWLVATSRELAHDLTASFGIPTDRVRVVHRGLSAVDPAARSDPGPVPVVGTAGPLEPGSGFAIFLNAARRVLDGGIDAEFVVVGQGSEEGDLRRRADRLRIADRVTFAGEAAIGLSFWDVLDVYCQPSTIPTVGRDLAQSLAHGLPAVVSDIEGLRSLVRHDRTGLRVPPGDTNALAQAIRDLLLDRPRARALGLAGREEVARDYDLDREAGLLADLYDSALEEVPEPAVPESG